MSNIIALFKVILILFLFTPPLVMASNFKSARDLIENMDGSDPFMAAQLIKYRILV